MTALHWTREGKQSGPANVLNGRYEIKRECGRWSVWDRLHHRTISITKSAADARNLAEHHAKKPGSVGPGLPTGRGRGHAYRA